MSGSENETAARTMGAASLRMCGFARCGGVAKSGKKCSKVAKNDKKCIESACKVHESDIKVRASGTKGCGSSGGKHEAECALTWGGHVFRVPNKMNVAA
jgi:hypothetical protein